MIHALSLLALLLPGQAGPMQGWQFVRPGILSGISGMALIEQTGDRAKFFIVHDNKADGQARAAYATLVRGGAPLYAELKWEGSPLPVDLESLSSVPRQPKLFLAGTSAGSVFVVEPGEDSVAVKSQFMLPDIPADSNFEGMTLESVGAKTLLVWGHRGDNPELARLHWCDFDPSTMKLTGLVQSKDIEVPWPAAKGARGISDLKLDKGGTLFLTAAADAGDDGPFQSVLYVGGTFVESSAGVIFREARATRLMWTDQHKIEGFELVPGKFGGVVFGTDDENLGSYIWSNLWP